MSSMLALLGFVIRELGLSAEDLLLDFEARLRVQKAVYLLQACGFGFNYDFDLYIRGPYSSALADDYMAIARHGDGEVAKLAEAARPDEKLLAALEELKKADTKVLELAATLHALLEAYKERYTDWTVDEVLDHLKFLKPWAEEQDIRNALSLLKVLGLFR
ncbi:MAG: hypothetical protein QXP31_06540 [Pyrobaculum sp.]